MHFQLPSIDRGVTSFLWAFGLALYVLFGLLAIGVSRATALALALLCLLGIFFFVRVFGGDEPVRS